MVYLNDVRIRMIDVARRVLIGLNAVARYEARIFLCENKGRNSFLSWLLDAFLYEFNRIDKDQWTDDKTKYSKEWNSAENAHKHQKRMNACLVSCYFCCEKTID